MSEFQSELESAKAKLASIDDSIKSITGRSPMFSRFGRGGGRGRGGPMGRGGGPIPGIRNRLSLDGMGPPMGRGFEGPPGFPSRRRSYRDEENGMEPFDAKRRRVIDEDEEPPKFTPFDTALTNPPIARPTLHSSVIMPVKEEKSRDEAISEIKGTERKEQKTRNRRMFGMLLGTLTRFRKDEKKEHFREQEKKQKEVEHKLEQEKREEDQKRMREKDELLNERKEQEFEIRRLTRKRNLTLVCDREIGHLKLLQPFIQTQTKPPIFYAPAKHTLRTIELQKKTERRIEELIAQKREKLKEDIERINTERERFLNKHSGSSLNGGDRGDNGSANLVALKSERKRRGSPGASDEEEEEEESDGEEEAPEPQSHRPEHESDGELTDDAEDTAANRKRSEKSSTSNNAPVVEESTVVVEQDDDHDRKDDDEEDTVEKPTEDAEAETETTAEPSEPAEKEAEIAKSQEKSPSPADAEEKDD